MAAYTSTQTGNWSAQSTWGGSGPPGAGDTATISNGHTVTVDTNTTVGSKASGVGHAVTINGATNVSYGVLQVSSGVTLTLRGFDLTSNTMMLINQYGQFNPQPGSTVSGDAPSDYGTQITNNGTINATGTSGSHITFTSASGGTWNNAQTTTAAAVSYCQDGVVLWRGYISRNWISNAAGTGIGSVGDSSLVFSSAVNCSFTSEKSSYTAISQAGDYYVDYHTGNIWWYCPVASTPSFNVAYSYLTFTTGWGIVSTANQIGNQAIFVYCDFTYMGTTTANKWCINAKNNYSAAASASRLFKLQYCTISFCKQFLNLWAATGTSGDPILVDSNTFNACDGTTTGYQLYFGAANSYVNVTNNTARSRNIFLITLGSGASTMSNCVVDSNTITAASIVQSALTTTWPNSRFSNNTFTGAITASTFRTFQDIGGDNTGRLAVYGNVCIYSGRVMSFCSYLDVYNNLFMRSYHHGLTAATIDDVKLQSVYVYNNLFYGSLASGTANGTYNASPSVESGYNHRYWIDDIQCINNTSAHNPNGYFGWGDCQDQGVGVNHTITRAVVVNNLSRTFDNAVTGGASCKRQTNSSSTALVYVHCLQWDYNSDYNFKARYATTLNNQGTPTLGGSNYNALASGSRNIPGVALFNSSQSSFSNRSLAYVYTNASTQTLSYDGGSATSIVFGSGTLTSNATALQTNSVNTGWLITDTGQSWVSTYGNASCPIGYWVKFTSGNASGQIAQITWVPGSTQARIVPYLASQPQTGDTFVIIKAEVTLTDTGAHTISAGIYLPDLWPSGSTPTSGTDSNISWADHSVTGSDPLLVSTSAATGALADATSYKFTAASPAKDAGTSAYAASTDYFGTARPQGGGYDIGFYEYLSGGLMFHLRRMSGGFTEMG